MTSKRLMTILLVAAGLACLPLVAGCTGGEDQADGKATSSTVGRETSQSGDIKGVVGDALEVGPAVVTVKALHSTFRPATPTQRLSEQAPTPPEAGESFYQAQVRVENRELDPIRVDPSHFACAIGDMVIGIEPTRSGPPPRSLLKNTSLDLLLTFKGPAGHEPVLLYSPPWYRGVIRVSPQALDQTSTTG